MSKLINGMISAAHLVQEHLHHASKRTFLPEIDDILAQANQVSDEDLNQILTSSIIAANSLANHLAHQATLQSGQTQLATVQTVSKIQKNIQGIIREKKRHCPLQPFAKIGYQV